MNKAASRFLRPALAVLAILLFGAFLGYRYLHSMTVGTGETRRSPDDRFVASAMDYSSRSFLTGEPRRWFELSLEGPGVRHHFVSDPLPGPYFGSRSAHSVIVWEPDSSAVRFVFPTATIELGTQPYEE